MVDLPPKQQRWEQVLAQVRMQCSEDAFRVWEIAGNEADGSLPRRPAVRFASLLDRLVLFVMRSIAFADALWVPILLSYGHIDWPSGLFAAGGIGDPFGRTVAAKKMCLLETLGFVLYLVGVVMRFNTTAVSIKMGKEFVSSASILSFHLAAPTFWTDCLSLVGCLWWAVGIRSVAALRVLRLWRLPSSSNRIVDITLGSGRTGFLATVLELLCATWMWAHFCGCLWFFTVAHRFETWEEMDAAYPEAMPQDVVHAYIQCWGDGVSLLVGWNSPTPASATGKFTTTETLYCIIVGPSASMFLAFIFGRILKAIDQAEEQELRLGEQLARVESLLASLETPTDLRQRVLQYYAFTSVHNLEKATYEMLFEGLSWNLHVELKLFLFEQLVLGAPFFEELPPLLVMDMVKSFELLVFSPGDIVVKKGQVGSEMFFIVKGGVDVFVDDDATVKVAEKRVGDYFGEVALVLDEARTAWVVTNSYCVLAQLTKDAFQEFTQLAPEVRTSMLEKIVQMRGQAARTARAPVREARPPSHREDVPLLK